MVVLQGYLKELDSTAPGNQQVSMFAALVTQGIGMIAQHQPQIDYNLQLIDQSLAGLTDFVASFKENPARRLINIWAGAMMGIVLAYLVRMDVFFAVLGTVPPGPWPNLGVALTGLIVGLGSNPTHDVIAALQEIKKYRASQNQPGPVMVGAGTQEAILRAGGPANVFGLSAPASGASAPQAGTEAAPTSGRPASGTGLPRKPAPPPLRRFR
jgi:hypothetical protein